MTGAFVGAAVAALLQYLRVRDRRVLLLVAMFLLQAFSLSREWWDVWKDVSQGAVCLAGLALLFALAPRHTHQPEPPESAEPPAGGAPAARRG